MKTLTITSVLALACLGCASTPAAGQVAPDQQVLARQVLSGEAEARWTALHEISEIPVRERGQAIRSALIQAVRQGNAVRKQAARDKVAFDQREDPDFYLAAVRELSKTDDASAISPLSGALGSGLAVVRALTEFGERAVPATISVVTAEDSQYYEIDEALITLRFMVERSGAVNLSPGSRAEIESVTLDLLSEPQYFTVLWRAIELAGVLDGPELKTRIEAVAASPSDFLLGNPDSGPQVDGTRTRAADALAGVAPLPRWSGRN